MVRSLYGVVMEQHATKGVMVTTSHFTDPALSYAAKETVRYQLSLHDYDELVKWLKGVRAK
jgi:restriction endonuclease Mrr